MYCSDQISCSAAITLISLCPFVSLYEITQLSGQNLPIKMSAFSLNSSLKESQYTFPWPVGIVTIAGPLARSFTLCRDNN